MEKKMSAGGSSAASRQPDGAEARSPDRLDSWKEIAAHLRRGARTVQRWEREEGLPIHRLQHEKLGSVYAYRHELDAWFTRRGAELEASAAAAERPAPSVAVLPFTDMSQEANQAYFCDGIAEEIINTLSRIAGLKTASRTASFRFRAPGKDTREIGRQLGVQSLLEGSVRKSGDRLRVAVRLADAESGFQIWAERYDRTFSDALELQDEIAAHVARALGATLTANEEGVLRQPPTTDINAYDCYLRGRNYYYVYSPKAVESALRMFMRAIQLDPNYARAYAGLADCWSYLYLYSTRTEEVRAQADWASRMAREMDPLSAQAQASRGLSLALSGAVEEADAAFREAIRLDPDLFEAHYFRARHFFVLGRLEEAAASYAKAMEARPDDYQSPLLVAQIEDDLDRHDRAAAMRRRGIGIAERQFQLNPDDARAVYMAANGLAALGERGRSRQLAERALAMWPEDPMTLYNLGCIFSLLGLTDQALDCLEKAVRRGLTQRGWYEHDSNLDAVRPSSRFQKLLLETK
ncbi:MAG TPA: tetratricopeptide repeat protein [Candidatus Sulfopaludibacter sp.]|nr:tetratricopeptide repeat protein [Candidatus Sulfopaludibacter sp.]